MNDFLNTQYSNEARKRHDEIFKGSGQGSVARDQIKIKELKGFKHKLYFYKVKFNKGGVSKDILKTIIMNKCLLSVRLKKVGFINELKYQFVKTYREVERDFWFIEFGKDWTVKYKKREIGHLGKNKNLIKLRKEFIKFVKKKEGFK